MKKTRTKKLMMIKMKLLQYIQMQVHSSTSLKMRSSQLKWKIKSFDNKAPIFLAFATEYR